MQGKTVVITGATSGIGEVAAIRLSEKGARIVMVARDKSRADATLKKLKGSGHTAHFADLSRLSEMKRVAGEIAAAEPRIDVLINNAGAVFVKRLTSVDGLEMTFATNHMAYFVMTNILLDRLKATPGARIVSTASNAHKSARLDFDDLQFAKRKYAVFTVYGTSKLMNILFVRELAQRLAGTGVTANSFHPGVVSSRFGSNNAMGVVPRLLRSAIMLSGVSPEEGAKTMIYLASSPDVADVSGEYFYKCKIATPTKEAQDDASARRLWEESVKISGVGG
jgi:NAD(P)-dependent dehydrogenase (short-subunit alcohol dehydrogenase family)